GGIFFWYKYKKHVKEQNEAISTPSEKESNDPRKILQIPEDRANDQNQQAKLPDQIHKKQNEAIPTPSEKESNDPRKILQIPEDKVNPNEILQIPEDKINY